MSTPSTATATLPAHHQYYSHHQNYQPAYNTTTPAFYTPTLPNPQYANSYGHCSNNATSGPHRSTNSTVTTHQPNAFKPSSQATADMKSVKRERTEKLERKPDWAEFYKHGIPQEVIVIDDESPTPIQPKVPRPTSASRPVPAVDNDTQPAAKRRRMELSQTYNSSSQQQKQYSNGHNSHSSHASSAYSDRTASTFNNTTAATSLTSLTSNGGDAVAGQKRKRTTRKALADEEKKREIEWKNDALSAYVPPPKPPIKAREVDVQVVHDRSVNRHEKCDDEDGHYIVHADASLTDRYQVVRLLGQGTFGKVVEAIDRRKGSKVAVKIIRAVPKYRDASRIELRVLSTLAQNDRHNRNKCIHLRDCFDFRDHICIVTDLLGQSVFDFLKSNQFVPFPSSHIQTFAKQLFTSVAFLHDLNLIHTDLKPENILLVNNAYQTFTYGRQIPSSSHAQSRTARFRKVLLEPDIRLIDFGSATFDDEYHSSVVSTRHYRAPEIILNLGWSFPCDIWSIGCILVEFFTGDALFQTHDNLEHLAMMEAVCNGKLDKEIVNQVKAMGRGNNRNQAASYFKPRSAALDYPNTDTSRASRKYVKAMKKLVDTIPPYTEFNKQFLDLLQKIFVYDPKKRITAKQALQHPWFRESLVDDGTEATRIKIEREKARNRAAPNGHP